MSFQKCPVCNGAGVILPMASGVNVNCSTCEGKKIINELTGLPPKITVTSGTVYPEPAKLSDEEVKALVKELNPLDDYSPDELLYYASPYFDELQAQKEIRTQELKDVKEPA